MILYVAAALAISYPQGSTRFPSSPAQDARHYDISLRIQLDKQQLDGHVDYTFTAKSELESIRLDAKRSSDWNVTFHDTTGHELKADWGSEHVIVQLPAPVAKGSDVTFRANLHGSPVDGFYFKENRYGDLMAFTDHYSIRARGWLPCEDHPSDRARFSLRVTYPIGNEIVGFGVPNTDEMESVEADGFRSTQFHSSSEIPPYMFAVVVGPLARVAELGDPRLVDHLVYKQDVAKAKAALVNHAAWIASMEAAFGRYPYGKYTTVQCPTRWGGFEAPGNVQLAEALFDHPQRGQGTLAHELVHMWFGDAIGYSRWREVWLSEGFASYFGPWLHAQTGGPTLKASLVSMRDRWKKSFEGRTKSVRDDRFAHPDQALNSNTYPKGAWVLHMLRTEVGDDAFFAALKDYVAACRGRSITTQEFVDRIEKQTKTELSWFFEQWLNGIGCPEIRAQVSNDAITISQLQNGKPYRFWLRLAWKNSDGHLVRKRVRIEEQTSHIPHQGTCDELVLDPEVELLFRIAK
jgi:aminopeptidase N